MRGFAAIGLVRPKTPDNVGGVMRAAWCYGAATVAIEDDRSAGKLMRSPLDVPNAWKHIPTLFGPLRDLIPYDCVPVAVDLVVGAVPLPAFQHPARAFYIFGPEDGTLGKAHLEWCVHAVMVPMANRACMNLAATVNVVLYDRMAKAERQARGVANSKVGLRLTPQQWDTALVAALKRQPDVLKPTTRQAVGGHARAAALSPERRSEIAKTAAEKRWGKHDDQVRKEGDRARHEDLGDLAREGNAAIERVEAILKGTKV